MNQLGDDQPSETSADAVSRRSRGGGARDDRRLALAAHLSGLFVSFLGPLSIWLLKRNDSAYVDQHSCEAINFQLTILGLVMLLGIVTAMTCGFGAVFTVPLIIAISLGNVVLSVIAAIKANDGMIYHYPMNLRIVEPLARRED